MVSTSPSSEHRSTSCPPHSSQYIHHVQCVALDDIDAAQVHVSELLRISDKDGQLDVRSGLHFAGYVYAAFKNAVMFQTVQQRFYGAHIEDARGTHRENRDYIRKEGKHRDTDKADTNLPDTFEESGELPAETERRVKQSEAILDMIESGASDAEILRTYPSALNHLPRIQQTRQTLLEDKYRRVRRLGLKVTYIYGATGVGKTRSVLDKYGDENVYRVTNYKHPFDGYKGEPVLIFDEFRSSIPLADMLNYLDVYPLMLPSRYADRVACYTRVFIISNIPIEKQYPLVQLEEPASYQAFLRRINDGIYEMIPDSGDEPF